MCMFFLWNLFLGFGEQVLSFPEKEIMRSAVAKNLTILYHDARLGAEASYEKQKPGYSHPGFSLATFISFL